MRRQSQQQGTGSSQELVGQQNGNKSQDFGSQAQPGSQKNPAKPSAKSRAVVNSATLAQLMGQLDPSAQFKTAEGIKTAAEIAAELAQNQKQKFDLQSLDGSFIANVRGGKSIVEAQPNLVQQLAELDKQQEEQAKDYGNVSGGGAAVGKADSWPEMAGSLSLTDLSREFVNMLPTLRTLSLERRIEVMQQWSSVPARTRVRGGAEYRLLKGLGHLSALKALSQFEKIEEGEQTMSQAGEQIDYLRGTHFEAPLDEFRTMEEAMASGGAVDDFAEIRSKRVSTDAPNLVFVVDTSGSMKGQRIMAAMAASQATATYYGPKGATFGLVSFANNPVAIVPPPEQDVDVVIDGILMLEAGGGTSYAVGLELAIRQALPNTTIMVFGDFEDRGFPAPEVYAIAHDKSVKVVGVASSDSGGLNYAAELCDEVYTIGSWDDPAAVALVALKAAN